MKNVKLFLATVTLIFTGLVSTAAERQSKFMLNPTLENKKCSPDMDLCILDISILEAYEILNQEKDELFEFDTKSYLPADFNQYDEDEYNLMAYELLNQEEDEMFEFDYLNYLPRNLHAMK